MFWPSSCAPLISNSPGMWPFAVPPVAPGKSPPVTHRTLDFSRDLWVGGRPHPSPLLGFMGGPVAACLYSAFPFSYSEGDHLAFLRPHYKHPGTKPLLCKVQWKWHLMKIEKFQQRSLVFCCAAPAAGVPGWLSWPIGPHRPSFPGLCRSWSYEGSRFLIITEIQCVVSTGNEIGKYLCKFLG